MEKSALAGEDLGNIVALEHVNLCVPDHAAALAFYVLGLGFTRDPYFAVGPDNMWINVGKQQFHLPRRDPQVLPGHVGVVMPDLAALQRRLDAISSRLSGTRFAYSRAPDRVEVTSPWGNELCCYAPGRFGSMRLGIAYVELRVKPGTAAGIARFYERVLGAAVSTDAAAGVTRVEAGNCQQIVFRESPAPIPAYDGHHIAIYINRLSGAHAFLKSRGLVSDPFANHQFRFIQIVDPDSGTPLAELEHEVRSMRHPMYLQPLVNRDPDVTLENLATPRGTPAKSV